MEKEKKQDIITKLKTGKKIGKDQFVIFIFVGILLMVIAMPVSETSGNKTKESGLWREDSGPVKDTDGSGSDSNDAENENDKDAESYERYMENKLEQAISVMDGAGKVKVIITVSASKEEVVEKDVPTVRNNTIESDAEGGSRNVNEMDAKEETVYVKKSDGSTAPYVKKTIQPVIEGIVVVAQGGDSPKVKKNITEAIVALFDIEPHKIIVVKMKSE